ncbi:MAG: GC-type dockerin domain-anchored protein [Planctomycetota bacterium]
MKISIRGCALALSGVALSLTAMGCASDADRRAEHLRQIQQNPKVAAKVAKAVRGEFKRTDGPGEANEYFMSQRLGTQFHNYPVDRLNAAVEHVNTIQEFRARDLELGILTNSTAGGISAWSELGPGNIGGRTREILINPTNPDIMYAAGVGGGVFKTLNGGSSWTPLLDLQPNIAVNSMAMDPNDPDVIYAGTGEGFFNGDAIRGLGIFKTTDGGNTWTQLAGTLDGAVPSGSFYRCNKIQVSPNDSNTVYAATRFGVWRSTDAGTTWAVVLENPNFLNDGSVPNGTATSAGFTDIQIRPDQNPDVIFAAEGSFFRGDIHRSTDGGTTWTNVSTGSPMDDPLIGRKTIAIAPSNPDFVYVCAAQNQSGSTGRVLNVFVSTNGGDTWLSRLNFGDQVSELLLTNPIASPTCGGSGFFDQGWYDNIIAVDPTDNLTIFVGGIDLFRSEDAGLTFRPIGYWFLDGDEPQGLHADQHEIVFHPGWNGTTNQTMYVGNDGGVYRTDNALDFRGDVCASTLGSVTWVDLNNGYGTTQFYHGDVAQTQDRWVGGAQDNGTSRGDGTASLNGWAEVFGGDGGYVQISPTNANTYFVETQNFGNIRGTTSNGVSFFNASGGLSGNDSGLFITPFAMNPSDATNLWTGGSNIWRTTTSGSSWSNVEPGSSGLVSAIAVDPNDGNHVVVGFSSGSIGVSNNGLAGNPSFTFVNAVPGFVASVAIDPNNSNTLYASSSTFGIDHIYRSTDNGATWSSIDGIGLAGIPDIPVHWISVRPNNSDQLYAGTEVGVFASDNGGTTWDVAGMGFPNTVVESLAFQGTDRLVAFTHGRGAFFADLTPVGTGNPCVPDLTTTGATLVGQPGFGVPDTIVDIDDLGYFLGFWLPGDASVADVTTTGATLVGQPGFGVSDGVVDLDDLGYFLGFWLAGCP